MFYEENEGMEALFTMIQRYQRKERKWLRGEKKWEDEFEKNHRTVLQ